jgi:hypothetical protein
MVGLWLIDCMLTYRSPHRQLKANRLLWPTPAVATMQMLATAGAADWRLSLWGNQERAHGGLTQLRYLLLYSAVSARLRTLRKAQRLIAVMVATGAILIGLGLAGGRRVGPEASP